MTARASGRLAVLVKTWPKLSETFILEEVLALERQGRLLQLHALEPTRDTTRHPAVDRVQAPVAWVPPASAVGRLLVAHLGLLARSPWRWLQTLRRARQLGAEGLRNFWRAGGLAAALRRDGVPHLHVHFIAVTADIGALAAQLVGIAHSISAHAKDIYLSRPEDLARRLAAAAFTVSCTEANCRALRDAAPQARVQRLYHGIDAASFHPSLRRRVEGPPRLLAVGRLVTKKGFDTLLAACALLARRGLDWRLDIVGYGAQLAALQAQAASLGLCGRVTFTGALARQQVVAHYAQASVVVMPSRIDADGDRDGIPNVLLEAMAMGLPVVATRVSGIPELISHGHDGLLVPPDDAPALAEAIAALLAHPARAALLGQVARATVTERFDNDRNLRLLSRLLEDCHAGHRHVAAA